MAQSVICGKQWDNADYDDILGVVANHILNEHDLDEEWSLEA